MGTISFEHQPESLSAFGITCGIFVISLKNGNLVHHDPEDTESFYNWLLENGIREVNPHESSYSVRLN
ncbi:MAG: hypothetical protein KDC11_04700 [Chitinophagaceae bacterium]|nr:hypothetical protein [Chitinophagaceae bacterium]